MIETLETRIAPANITWTGAFDSHWAIGANWSGGIAPLTGDTLFFDDTGVGSALINDTVSGSTYSIIFSANTQPYSITGNSVAIGASGVQHLGAAPLTIGLTLVGSGSVTQDLGDFTLTARNYFTGGVYLTGGTLKISSDGNLGALSGDVYMADGGTLEVLNSVSSARDFTFSSLMGFSVPATKTLNLTGFINDGALAGFPALTGGGKLVLVNNASTFTGAITVGAGSVEFRGVTTTLTGPGYADVEYVPGGSNLASITLRQTDLTSVLTVGSISRPLPTQLAKIIGDGSSAHIGSIQLNRHIVFGDGVADVTPDLDIPGKAVSVTMFDVNPNTILKFGSGLPYDITTDTTTPDTYNNNPNITFRDVLGAGVTIDITGDGTPGGFGGGGLGTLSAREWNFPGVIKTTQSIDKFIVVRGDNRAVLEVDKFNVGVLTSANVNLITVLNGKWNSIGTAIEGFVDTFDVGGFATAASLSAGYVKTRFTVAGSHLDVGGVALGGTVTLTSLTASPLVDIRVGSFTGTVNALGSIGTFTSTGNFSGSLTATTITKVQALKFVDANAIDARITATKPGGIGEIVATTGGMTKTNVQSEGNIGSITLKGAGSAGSMIRSTITAKGSIGAMRIGTSGTTSNLDASVISSGTFIGDISIYGVMTGSIIAAGISRGTDGVFGNPYGTGPNVDTAINGGGAIGKISLSSAAFSGKTVGTNNAIAHTNAVLGGSIGGVFQLGTSAAKIAAISAANTSRDLRSVGGPLAGDLLFFTF